MQQHGKTQAVMWLEVEEDSTDLDISGIKTGAFAEVRSLRHVVLPTLYVCGYQPRETPPPPRLRFYSLLVLTINSVGYSSSVVD